MANILETRYGGGESRFTAIMRIRQGSTIVHREVKAFALRGAAANWVKAREVA
jgi:hypothetical protein